MEFFRGRGARLLKNKALRYCFYGRLSCSKKFILSNMARVKMKKYRRYGLEIDFENIDGGLSLLHPYGITVNPKAILGKNVTLFKGVTVGSVRSGSRMGSRV